MADESKLDAVALLNLMDLDEEAKLTRGYTKEGNVGVYYLNLEDLIADVQEHLL